MTSALDTPASPTANADRHAALILGWQSSHTSDNTRRAYGRDLGQYLGWLDGIGLDPDTGERVAGLDVLAVKRNAVDAYRLALVGGDLSPGGKAPSAATVARKLSAVSSFYAYAVSAGTLDANPAALVKRPKVDADASTTEGMTADQARALMTAARHDGPRSAALVALLLTSGIRIGEALGATTADLGHDSGHRVLTVTRKGGKRAKVALAPAAVGALDAYLGSTGADLVRANGEPAPVFTTSTGKRWAPSEAFRTVQRLARVAGIEGKISPHSMRHTFATIHLDAGGTLHDLQDSMGHADPRTTRRYDRARNTLSKSASYTVAGVLGL
jgi:integrase/recombinase XerD